MAAWIALVRETWSAYQRHNGPWLAAALAYFAAFAIAPLIIVVVEIAGFFLHGHQQALHAIYSAIPAAGGNAVRQIVSASFLHPRQSVLAQIVGWVIFVVAAIGLFGALQFALNAVWDVEPQRHGLWQTVRERAWSFCMLLVAALLLMLSVVFDTVLNAFSATLSQHGAAIVNLTKTADFVVSLFVVWLLFTLLFEYLPDTRISWRDVWAGAGITALLFTGGQTLLGWYLGRAAVTSTYGAFGSLVVFLLWANYSSQIVLLGAEFTHVYAQRRGTQTR
jgi:membrane protein